MPNFELSEAFVARWNSKALTTSPFTGGLHQDRAPKGSRVPYATFNIVGGGGVSGRTIQADGQVGKGRAFIETQVTVNCYARGKPAAALLAKRVLAAFPENMQIPFSNPETETIFWRYFDDFCQRLSQEVYVWTMIFEVKYSQQHEMMPA